VAERSLVFDHVCAPLSSLDMEIVKSVPPGGNWQDIPYSTMVKSARLMQISNSGGRTTYYGRMDSNLPSYTISTYFNRPGNGTFIHPEQDRLISLREAARLQSFRDSYRFQGSFSSKLKQVGNAVPPIMGRVVGSLLRKGRTIDLFCGAGGLSQGLQDSGHRVVLSADQNPNMCKTYSFNHPDTHVLNTDLSSVEGRELLYEEIEATLGGKTLTTLAGGPPCQGFSTAGKWNVKDSRNLLVFRMISVAESLRPSFILLENVPGIKWISKGALLARIKSRLNDIGYHASVLMLRAEEYGIPQRRRRVFLVCSESGYDYPIPKGEFSQVSSTRRSAAARIDAERQPPVSVREAIDDLPVIPSGGGEPVSSYDNSATTSSYQHYMRSEISLGDFISMRAEQA
jgi:DNA (cytosine-5)-methyltransferase 1